MKTLQKKDSAINHSRAQANQPSVQRVGFPAVYGHISAPAQLKKGVIQRIWYKKVGDTIVEQQDGDKPAPNTHNPKHGIKHQGKTITLWVPKGSTPQPLSYKDKVGPIVAGQEFTISSDLVKFSQDSIARTFTSGGSIDTTIDALKSGTINSSALPAIRVVWSKQDPSHKDARLVTLDNRRLHCCQQANTKIKCVLVDYNKLPQKELDKFTNKNGRAGDTEIYVRQE